MTIVKGKDVIGLNVVSVADGSVVETVDDIGYNPTNHRIEAILVSSGGLFSDAKAILMDDVSNIGTDAVMIPDANVVRSIKDIAEDTRSIADSNMHLVKTNVLTTEGKDLGSVTDIFFDSASGAVDSMEVSQGGLKTLSEGKKSIRPSDIVTIGKDATIVSTYTELKLEQQGEEGGIKGAVNDMKQSVDEGVASAKRDVQHISESVNDTVNTTVNNTAKKVEHGTKKLNHKNARSTRSSRNSSSKVAAKSTKK